MKNLSQTFLAKIFNSLARIQDNWFIPGKLTYDYCSHVASPGQNPEGDPEEDSEEDPEDSEEDPRQYSEEDTIKDNEWSFEDGLEMFERVTKSLDEELKEALETDNEAVLEKLNKVQEWRRNAKIYAESELIGAERDQALLKAHNSNDSEEIARIYAKLEQECKARDEWEEKANNLDEAMEEADHTGDSREIARIYAEWKQKAKDLAESEQNHPVNEEGADTNITSPLEQFEIRNLLGLDLPLLGNLHIYLTNIAFYLSIAAFTVLALSLLATNYKRITSNTSSISQDTIYATIHSIVTNQINAGKGQNYSPLFMPCSHLF